MDKAKKIVESSIEIRIQNLSSKEQHFKECFDIFGQFKTKPPFQRNMNEKKYPNILIAEDVESNFLYLKAVLSKLNATIFWAKNGLEAVEICENDPIDLVFMDLQMPEMNGYEATVILKKKFPNLPIVAQTAFAMSDDREKALDSGCDDYLAKPIKSKDLLSVVEKFIKIQNKNRFHALEKRPSLIRWTFFVM